MLKLPEWRTWHLSGVWLFLTPEQGQHLISSSAVHDPAELCSQQTIKFYFQSSVISKKTVHPPEKGPFQYRAAAKGLSLSVQGIVKSLDLALGDVV